MKSSMIIFIILGTLVSSNAVAWSVLVCNASSTPATFTIETGNAADTTLTVPAHDKLLWYIAGQTTMWINAPAKGGFPTQRTIVSYAVAKRQGAPAGYPLLISSLRSTDYYIGKPTSSVINIQENQPTLCSIVLQTPNLEWCQPATLKTLPWDQFCS